MRVFLSWSGEQSRQCALALRDWLPLIIHYAEPWMSEADIPAGERWATEIGKELQESTFGILCVTRENLAAPWILFEAGALAKSLAEGTVCPLLLDADFTDLSGPLTQFQAKKCNERGIRELVSAINSRAQTTKILEQRLSALFGALWPRLEKRIKEIPPPAVKASVQRSVSEVLEELVASVRSLDRRLAHVENGIEFLFDENRESAVDPNPDVKDRRSEMQAQPVTLDQIRAYARPMARGSGFRNLAKAVGVPASSVKEFVSGATPSSRENRLWILWYESEIAHPHQPPATD